MGTCAEGNCSITESDACCFECLASRRESCIDMECTCDAIEDGEVDRSNYIHCPHYNK